MFKSSRKIANASANSTLFLATLNAQALPFLRKALVDSEPRTVKREKMTIVSHSSRYFSDGADNFSTYQPVDF